MVIHDWASTPIYHILVRKMPVLKAIAKYCNKTTLNKLAGDLRERNEFEERNQMRQRRIENANKQKNPFLARDSDSTYNEEDIKSEKMRKISELRKMKREERI